MIIQTVVQNALRKWRRTQPTPPAVSRLSRDQDRSSDDEPWHRQDSLPWIIGFAVALAFVAALVVALV